MSPKRAIKPKSEWSERVVSIERVTKVVKGGKKMSFRAILVVGNEQGKVGVGVGKAGDVITAVRKGVTDGKKTYYLSTFNKLKLYTTPIKWPLWCSKSYTATICSRFWGNRREFNTYSLRTCRCKKYII
jgi:hypothetical protein